MWVKNIGDVSKSGIIYLHTNTRGKKIREIDLFLLYFTKTFVKYRNKINSKKKICSPQIMAHVPPFVNVKW